MGECEHQGQCPTVKQLTDGHDARVEQAKEKGIEHDGTYLGVLRALNA